MGYEHEYFVVVEKGTLMPHEPILLGRIGFNRAVEKDCVVPISERIINRRVTMKTSTLLFRVIEVVKYPLEELHADILMLGKIDDIEGQRIAESMAVAKKTTR